MHAKLVRFRITSLKFRDSIQALTPTLPRLDYAEVLAPPHMSRAGFRQALDRIVRRQDRRGARLAVRMWRRAIWFPLIVFQRADGHRPRLMTVLAQLRHQRGLLVALAAQLLDFFLEPAPGCA